MEVDTPLSELLGVVSKTNKKDVHQDELGLACFPDFSTPRQKGRKEIGIRQSGELTTKHSLDRWLATER